MGLNRALRLLTDFGKESKSETVIPRFNQETITDKTGTTWVSIGIFMGDFGDQISFSVAGRGPEFGIHFPMRSPNQLSCLDPKSSPADGKGQLLVRHLRPMRLLFFAGRESCRAALAQNSQPRRNMA